MMRFCLWLSVLVSLASVCQSPGTIQSSGFPHGYGPDHLETWKLCAQSGHVLALTLLHLDLEDSYECDNDYLKISKDQNLLAKLCGTKNQEELQSVNPSLRSSSGGCLDITFKTDYSNTKRHAGFVLLHTSQDVDECWENHVVCSHFCHNFIGGYNCSCKPGYYLDQNQHLCHVDCTEQRYGAGMLVSPGSPGPYFENARCSFRLSVDTGYQLHLKFTGVFDVESRDGQCVDFVEIKTGHQTFGPFCGKDKPADFLTASQDAEVIFHSDLEGTNQGFTLEYKPKEMQCLRKVSPDSTVSPMKDLYAVGDTVVVHCNVGYFLLDDDWNESTCMLDGSWSPELNCEPVDCGVPNLPFMMRLWVEVPQTTYKHNMTVTCFSNYYQLEGAANFTCDATGNWVSEIGEVFSSELPQCTPVCGITQDISDSRILGGKKAQLGQIPWQLLVKQPHRGGASLINDYWAITAAHVVEDKRPRIFMGGMIDARAKSIQMETEKIVIHPDYNQKSFDNDIALMKMTSRVPLSRDLLPVCLPNAKSSDAAMMKMKGTVSGFGGTSETNLQARFLWYANVEEYKVCFEMFKNVTENMFCAGDVEGKADSCKGDSGGPLVVPAVGFGSAEKPYRLVGIVSWGPECWNHYKGYYTKVENYLAWIKDTVKNN